MVLVFPVTDDGASQLDDDSVEHSSKRYRPLTALRLGQQANEDDEDLQGIVSCLYKLNDLQQDAKRRVREPSKHLEDPQVNPKSSFGRPRNKHPPELIDLGSRQGLSMLHGFSELGHGCINLLAMAYGYST